MTQRLSLFDTCSITNISHRSEKFWVHLVSVYVITFIVLKVCTAAVFVLRSYKLVRLA